MIRFFDISISIFILIFFSPILALIAFSISMESKGGIIFKQKRVGKNNVDFILLKFRTMYNGSDAYGSLTIGTKDNRITKTGYFLRKYKIDELPQLVNVLKGEMSIVGPRPEVRKFVDLYNDDQKIVLTVRPGITDYASIAYKNENTILAQHDFPEKYYIEVVMANKLSLNLKVIELRIIPYFQIIFKTISHTLLLK